MDERTRDIGILPALMSDGQPRDDLFVAVRDGLKLATMLRLGESDRWLIRLVGRTQPREVVTGSTAAREALLTMARERAAT